MWARREQRNLYKFAWLMTRWWHKLSFGDFVRRYYQG